ncbi:DUF1249 domain-containing protein [bacterium endosymbiont of Escarpia laminata]|nr:MAG: DUF1249 domain-containing protein [bacterium endosymbiont of Escarpia laminata]RLJ17506.1 MAG: DUF1249 domain-containing protein [bacterium endosymbiont of Escarpia laminata]
MRAPYYPWSLRSLLSGRPTIGVVIDLSEENYSLLMRMAPELHLIKGELLSCLDHGMDLHLEIKEQTPYTTLLHLTYYFPHATGHYPDPDAMLRVYHDSRQVDVIDIRQSALPLKRWGDNPTLEQRWKINLFLSKWLAYCVLQGHSFNPGGAEFSGVHAFEAL